jgi:hypothetical protein
MSLLPPDASFHERVQELFAAFRGRGVSLSAIDVELLEAWAKTGAPFEVVARGIRKAAEGQLFDATEDDRGLRSLVACRYEVEREIQKFASASAGRTADAGAAANDEPLHLKRHKKLLSSLKKSSKQHSMLEAAVARLFTLTPPQDIDGAQWREDLAHALIIRALPWKQRFALLQQARDFVQKAPAMSKAARRESRRLHRAALVRRELSLPAFW